MPVAKIGVVPRRLVIKAAAARAAIGRVVTMQASSARRATSVMTRPAQSELLTMAPSAGSIGPIAGPVAESSVATVTVDQASMARLETALVSLAVRTRDIESRLADAVARDELAVELRSLRAKLQSLRAELDDVRSVCRQPLAPPATPARERVRLYPPLPLPPPAATLSAAALSAAALSVSASVAVSQSARSVSGDRDVAPVTAQHLVE